MDDKTRPYVKLGLNAGGFFAPASRFKVKAGEVKQLPAGYNKDVVITTAISGGHLIYATEPEIEAYKRKAKTATHAVATGDDSKVAAALEEANAQIEELTKKLEEADNKMKDMEDTFATLEKVAETRAKSITLLSEGKEDIYKYDEDGLMKYLSDSYELSKEDTKKLNKMSFEEKQSYAYDLEMESSEGE